MSTFMQWEDVVYSFAQAVGIAVVVILIHTYCGYTASGGLVGVGLQCGYLGWAAGLDRSAKIDV